MSEVAGRLAPQVGAYHLMRQGGGRGTLMGGVSGVYAAKVVVIGAGVSGMNAAAIALGMQAEVLLLDKNIDRLREVDRIYQGHLQTVASNAYEIERAVLDADLVIGAVLVPGAKAPTLISNELVSRMKAGSVLVDIAIDQGGCFEDSRPDHPRRTDVHGARLGLLLRREHARRGPAHLDVRPHQRHPAVRGRVWPTGAGGRPAVPIRPWPWGSTPTTASWSTVRRRRAPTVCRTDRSPTSSAERRRRGGVRGADRGPGGRGLSRSSAGRARRVPAHVGGVPS